MSIKNLLYQLTPPYIKHIYHAHKVYNGIKIELNEVIAKQINSLSLMRKKISNGEKIKVAFLHMYATDCQDLSLFELMLTSPFFDPYFIVNPDILRSQEHLEFNYQRSIIELTEKYGCNRVLEGYDSEHKTYIDYTEQFAMASTNNPYDGMAQELYRIKYWANKGIPVFYIPYYYMGMSYVTIENFKIYSFPFLWKIFAPNKATLSIAREYEATHGRNVIVTGYPKMDKIPRYKKSPSGRKRIIIAPHHSNQDDPICRGGFRDYAQDLLSLPAKYPNIDFIFRPHPQLKEALKAYWTPEQISQWLEQLLNNPNVTYSTQGDYLDLFANSDGIIHDCGSFIAEYLYLNKPCAFIYRKGCDYNKELTRYGLEFFKYCYPIHKIEDWSSFIENVIILGNDNMRKKREKFAIKKVMYNYPYATQTIYNHILNSVK